MHLVYHDSHKQAAENMMHTRGVCCRGSRRKRMGLRGVRRPLSKLRALPRDTTASRLPAFVFVDATAYRPWEGLKRANIVSPRHIWPHVVYCW